MVTIINYGSGNVQAIANIYRRLNIEFNITEDPEVIGFAERLILPGVGDFDETMMLLGNLGIKEVLDEQVLVNKIPILGVCVGMQILGESSEEGISRGFGWVKGRVRKFNIELLKTKPHLPHMGWNTISPKHNHSIFDNIVFERGFYFLHSYYFECENEKDILSHTNYGCDFASAINHKNIFGFQFHPEKSHKNGLELFKNFANIKC